MKILPINILFNSEKSFIHYNTDFYNKIYETIINEHAKNLYTPYNLLNDIIENCLNYSYGSFILQYTSNDIISLIDNSYKYYFEFWTAFNNIKNKKQFQIYVAYINPQANYEYKKFYQYFSDIDVNTIMSAGKTVTSKAACLNEVFGKYCFIILNKNLLTQSNLNYSELTDLLDHEINHYFQLIDPKLSIKDSKKIINNKIKKIAYDCGYNLNNPDTKLHLINASEFISMTADVCNTIEKNNIDYYTWLKKCSEAYIVSKDFLTENKNIQDSLFFSFMVRWLDQKRWKLLKESVYLQLNNPKINILQSAKEMLNTFMLRLKN